MQAGEAGRRSGPKPILIPDRDFIVMTDPIVSSPEAGLEPYRRRIDALDRELIGVLGRRFAIVRQVAAHKAEVGLPAAIPARIAEVIAAVRGQAAEQGLDADFLEALYRRIIAEACALEERLMAPAKG